MMISLFVAVLVLLQPVIEITDIQDRPNDAGDGLYLFLDMPDDTEDFLSCTIYRKEVSQPDSCWRPVSVELIPIVEEFIVDGYDPDYIVEPGREYMYRPVTVTLSGDTLTGEAFISQIVPKGEYFKTDEVSVLIAGALFILLIFYYFKKAQKGLEMYLRPIAGIEAIDEAIGRATEMGKPILYVPGLSTISDVATIASLTILGRVAKKIGQINQPPRIPASP